MTVIREIEQSEGGEVRRLILSLFQSRIFSDYTYEGRTIVEGYVSTESLVESDIDNFTLVAEEHGTILGAIKIKRGNHVSMLFVREQFQRSGIGRRLLDAARMECGSRIVELTCLTANSSRFALPFFERYGFTKWGRERNVHGVVFTPMELTLATASKTVEATPDDAPHF